MRTARRALLTGTMVIAVLTAALVTAHAQSGRSKTEGDTRKLYYLTVDSYPGGGAPAACQLGFHMASIQELVDRSNLKYDPAVGYTLGDSGQGAPTHIRGWIRTGYDSEVRSAIGRSNCRAYTSSNWDHYGTVALVHNYFALPTPERVSPWAIEQSACAASWPVWCVQD